MIRETCMLRYDLKYVWQELGPVFDADMSNV